MAALVLVHWRRLVVESIERKGERRTRTRRELMVLERAVERRTASNLRCYMCFLVLILDLACGLTTTDARSRE